MSDFTRRDFIKTSTLGASIIGVSSMSATLGALEYKPMVGSNNLIRSYCEMCTSRCQIEATIANGKVTFIEGNKYSKGMGGSVCAKGGSGESQLYDKQRLVTPLIRVGKRGENKWRKASYDEAMDYIADNLNKIKKKHGAKSVIFSGKTGEHFSHLSTLANAFGSPNIFSHLSTCPVTYKMALPHTFGTSSVSTDYSKSKYILNFGHNLYEGINITRTKSLMKANNSESSKLVVLDPRFSIIASKADEWLPVKPGTDLAFVLALIHVWIKEGKYHKEFVDKYTVGIEELTKNTKTTTPAWQEEITGIKASTVERIANEIYAASPSCIIDWGHKTTTSKAEYQRTRAIITANVLMGNIDKEGGIFFKKKAKVFNKLAGKTIAPTLSNPDKDIKKVKEIRIDRAGLKGDNKFVSKKHGSLIDIPNAILSSDPYPVKGWFMMRTNPVLTVADTDTMKKAINKLDFMVSVDIYASDTAMLADVILPEATYLERDEGIVDKSSKAPAYMMRNKAVEPINGTLGNVEIFRTLAKKLKIDDKYTWNNITEYRIIKAKKNTELIASLMKKGYVSFGIPPLLGMEKRYVDKFVSRYPYSKKFLNEDGLFDNFLTNLKTPSGKIEIFSEKVENAFPGYGAAAVDDMELSNGYPYILTSGKTAIHSNAHTHNVPNLNMLMSDNPVWMNTITAKKENLKDGDTIYLQNKTGKEKATVFVTEGIRPDTLFVYFGFGVESKRLERTNGKGTNQSRLLPLIKGTICSTMITNVGVDIVKV